MTIKYISNPELFAAYRNHEADAHDFVCPSLARPVIRENELSDKVDVEQVRAMAGSLVGLDGDQTVFTRNGTEALHLAGQLLGGDRIYFHGIENYSTFRAFTHQGDHANVSRKDSCSTYADSIVAEDSLLLPKPNNVARQVPMDCMADIICLPEVTQSGKAIDVAGYVKKIKRMKPNVTVVVDGSQALGNKKYLPVSQYFELGVDCYVSVAHKHVGAHPLGLLYCSERVKNNRQIIHLETPILQGMFPESWEVQTNDVPLNPKRLSSLQKTISHLKEKPSPSGSKFSITSRLEAPFSSKYQFSFKAHDSDCKIINICGHLPEFVYMMQETPCIFQLRGPIDTKKLDDANILYSDMGSYLRLGIAHYTTDKNVDALLEALH